MEEQKKDAPETTPKELKRSSSYPSLTPQQAYNWAFKINEKFSNIEVTRKEMANVLKVHDNAISRDVAAATAYGFFEKTLQKGEKDFKYKITDLFGDIFRYENEKQKKLSFIIAFGKPKLWRDLIEKFDGSTIPEELNNTLIKHHGITAAASKEVADLFVNSGIEVGVIENRVLKYKLTLNTVSKTQYAEILDEAKDSQANGDNNGNGIVHVPSVNYTNPKDSGIKIPIHLTKNKMAYLGYPEDINSKDIKLLEHAIKGILLRLELENETDVPVSKKVENTDEVEDWMK